MITDPQYISTHIYFSSTAISEVVFCPVQCIVNTFSFTGTDTPKVTQLVTRHRKQKMVQLSDLSLVDKSIFKWNHTSYITYIINSILHIPLYYNITGVSFWYAKIFRFKLHTITGNWKHLLSTIIAEKVNASTVS